jgi:AAA+ ATPase superfamily predicted ATPase
MMDLYIMADNIIVNAIMFWNRKQELAALRELDRGGGLAVVWGRRRIGKTRLLLEWSERARGVYTVADQSAPHLQRAYFARAISQALPGFADVTYPDWERLLSRLTADATTAGFTGPIVIDELPYLVAGSPELPSVLQRWIDHDARRAKLRVALAGSSQRMMQGLVLPHTAPLYGRARVTLDLAALSPDHLHDAFGRLTPAAVVEHWAAFGGVPRYWELAAERRGSARDRVLGLALEPLGPLFAEPDRLLLEESPPAVELRPVLDAIGAGAHRLSEIAGRLGRPVTSLGHALDRLMGMTLIRREVPYGESAKGGKRSLYKIDDPFLRMWFRVVAPNRAALTAGTPDSRRAILDDHWHLLLGQAWEDLCRRGVPTLRGALARRGPWRSPGRYWRGVEPEWDLVADAVEGDRVLLGEAWFSARPATTAVLVREAERLARRPPPAAIRDREVVRALFVPATAARKAKVVASVHIVSLADLQGRTPVR